MSLVKDGIPPYYDVEDNKYVPDKFGLVTFANKTLIELGWVRGGLYLALVGLWNIALFVVILSYTWPLVYLIAGMTLIHYISSKIPSFLSIRKPGIYERGVN